MAQCADINKRNIVIKKNIEVRNYTNGGQSSSATFEHDEVEPFFNVVVHPRGRNEECTDHVSVMINRCWFYPHFIPGVVYGSLGWTVSVVDVEGQERFHEYFGNEDFLSLAWGEDFFQEHEFGLETFVKRSVLLNDPDKFLPDDVLTVRCEVFYECHTGDAEMFTRGEEINKFLVKAFIAEMGGLSNPSDSADGNVAVLESTSSTACSVPALVFSTAEHWRKALRMMKESLNELEDAFELYSKLQMLKDFKDQNPRVRGEEEEQAGLADQNKIDKDFKQDIEKAACFFKDLLKDSNLGSGITTTKTDAEQMQNIDWWDETDGVVKVTHQLARILALHKHMQISFENCKSWYKEAANRMKSYTTRPTDPCGIEEDITELFSLYNETLKTFETEDNQREDKDSLLLYVSRFLSVFLNTLRVLALRLYFPVCVLETPISEPNVPDLAEQEVSNEPEPSDRSQESTSQTADTNENLISEDTANKTNEKWNFIIETSDGKVFDVPFEEGQSTLGSLIRAASPVFDRMLATPMLEAAQRRVKLEDINYETLRHFVSYIQTGTIDTETLDDSSLLYRMAHKYQVPLLQRACAERMCQLMSHLNADDVGAFSQYFEDDMLMSWVDAHGFRPRLQMAVMGLQELNVSPLSPESEWSQAIADVPVVDMAIEHIVPKENYDFYN